MKTPPTLVQDVTSYLRNAIVSGNLKQGEKLTEISLQKKWGISRSPIREAFRVLEQEGLVLLLPRKGAYVADITLEELSETTIVVATLEGLAAKLSLPHLTSRDFEKMETLVKKMQLEAKEFLINDYTRSHSQFHETLISACGNKILIDIIGKLRRRYVRPQITSYYFVQNIQDAVHGHLKILSKVKNGDPQEVENIVKDHILSALVVSKESKDVNIGETK